MSTIRVCRTCGLKAHTEDELKLFCGDKANKTGYSTICLKCNNIRTNEYKKNNYEKVIKAKRRHLVEKKIKAINYKGGKCVECGLTLEDSHHSVFDFHHVDEAEKEYHPSDLIKSRKWDMIKKEIDKCILVCANCHRIIHHSRDDEYYNKKDN